MQNGHPQVAQSGTTVASVCDARVLAPREAFWLVALLAAGGARQFPFPLLQRLNRCELCHLILFRRSSTRSSARDHKDTYLIMTPGRYGGASHRIADAHPWRASFFVGPNLQVAMPRTATSIARSLPCNHRINPRSASPAKSRRAMVGLR